MGTNSILKVGLILLALLVWGHPTPASAAPAFQTTPESLLNYQPEKYVLSKTRWRFLDEANWNDKTSLDRIEDSDLEDLVCAEVETIRTLACNSEFHPAIQERKTVRVGKRSEHGIALWHPTSAVSSTGALIVKEADNYSLYYFRRRMMLEDLDQEGGLAIVTYESLIYKAWDFFGTNRDPSVWWKDIFIFDGVLQKANQKYPEFYVDVIAGYRERQEIIRRFDAMEYASVEKRKYADPGRWEKGLIESKRKYLQRLDIAIKAVEMILEKR
jgi:hypothetical protein